MKKTKIISLILALAMVLAMFAGCGSTETAVEEIDPADRVSDAIDATIDEFASLSGLSKFAGLNELIASGSTSQEMGLYLTDANVGMDISDLYGTGIEVYAESSTADRLMYMLCDVLVGGYDAFSYEMSYDDADMFIRSEDILGDVAFTLNTMTMAEDLAAITGEEVEMTGYNIFDMMDEYMDESGNLTLAISTVTGLTSAYQSLLASASYTEPAEATITCGTDDITLDAITVSFTPTAVADFIADVFETISNDSYFKLMIESAAISSGYDYEEYVSVTIENIETAFSELEDDMSLIVYLDDTFIRGIDVVYAEDTTAACEIRFGAQSVYDNFELYFENTDLEDSYMYFTSYGNHGYIDDIFENTTSFVLHDEGYEAINIAVNTYYDATTGDYDFDLSALAEGETVTASATGNALVTEGELVSTVDEFTIDMMGMSLGFAGYYDMRANDGVTTIDAATVMPITEVTDAEADSLSSTAQINLMSIAIDLAGKVPLIATMFGM